MNKQYIKPYQDLNCGFEFLGCDSYDNGKYHFLINRYRGTSMIVSSGIAQKMLNRCYNDDLRFKLIQRGLATIPNGNLCNEELKTKYIPKFFLIEITKSCNLRCRYCFRNFETVEHNDKEISDEKIDQVCEYILNFCLKNDIKNPSIQVWGGEPLLRLDKIIRIKKYFNHNRIKMKVIIQTNGTLITPKVAQILHENDIKTGISFDGPKFLQNMHRIYAGGRSTFDDVLNGIKNLRNIGHDFSILSVITRNSCKVADEMLDFFVKDLGCNTVKFNMMHASDRASENLSFIDNQAEEYTTKLLNKLIALNEEGYHATERNIIDRIENLLIRDSGGFCESKGCQYGKYMVTFDSDGNIYPCELTDYKEEIIGNIKQQEDLSFLIEKGMETQTFFIKDHDDECNDCSFWVYCRGGCSSAVKYRDNKNIMIDTTECNVNKFFYLQLIDLILNKPIIVERLLNAKIEFV